MSDMDSRVAITMDDEPFESFSSAPSWAWFNTEGRINPRTFRYRYGIMIVGYLAVYLLGILVAKVVHSVGAVNGVIVVMAVCQLGLYGLSLMMAAKRAHDLGYSGGITILPLVWPFLLFQGGVPERNKYGPYKP